MKTLTLLFFALFVGQLTHAKPPQGGCRLSYHSDSAGRGIEGGFKSLNLRPNPLDENCYLQGVEEGNALPKNDRFCLSEFENGKTNGLQVSASTSGNECFNKGYIAGFALLGAAARAHDVQIVGLNCVNQYKQGFSDGLNDGAAKNQPTSNPGTSCYLTGFYDASQLGARL